MRPSKVTVPVTPLAMIGSVSTAAGQDHGRDYIVTRRSSPVPQPVLDLVPD
jgi:hypothetical protein